MKIKQYFTALFVVIFCLNVEAQNQNRAIDSLKRILSITKSDTQKISLRFQIAELNSVVRTSFWDSLAAEAKNAKMPIVECRALNNIGYICLYVQSDESRGINSLKRSIELAEKIASKNELLYPLLNLSAYYSRKNDIRNALIYNYRALKIAEELKDLKATNIIYSGIASSYYTTGEIGKALQIHLKCLKISRELKDTQNIATSLLVIGADYVELKEEKKAAVYYLECKKYTDKFKGTTLSVQINNSVGSGYNIFNQIDSAYKYSNKAYLIAKEIGFKRGVIGTLVDLASIKYKMGENETAKKMALEALRMTNELNFKIQIPNLAIVLKKIYLKEKNYKAALETYEMQINVRDSLGKEEVRKKIIEKEFNYNLEKKENENKLLAQQNQIQNLQLKQNKYFLVGFGVLVLLILIIAFLVLKQNKLRAAQQSMLLEQRLISSQMNPHFVFNSLNSIQQLIMNKENDKAELYLSKFAKLIRELLESNTKESLTVEEEVKILTGYTEMEARRFGKSFAFSVHIDPKVDKKSNIPHMMIQPFIENAIWHGLLPKEGDKNLTVSFLYDTEKTIKCIVEDNGVGREASRKKPSTFKKESLALSFINQRLELMKETLKINGSVHITDKLNERGESLGTKVEIVLPLMQK